MRIAGSLAWLAVLLLAGVLLTDTAAPIEVRFIGVLTLVGAFAPSIDYLLTRPALRRPIPFLPVVGVLYGLYFGWPFAFGTSGQLSRGIFVDPGSQFLLPAILALGGWLVLLAGYFLVGQTFRLPSWDPPRFLGDRVLIQGGMVLLVVGLVQDIGSVLVPVPQAVAGVLNLLGLLGWVGAGFLVAAWGRDRVRLGVKVLGLAGILTISILELTTGSVANLARFWIVLVVAAWIGHDRRLPVRWWLGGVLAMLAMVAFRGGIGEYRQQAWVDERLGIVERVSVFTGVFEEALAREGLDGLFDTGGEVIQGRLAYGAVLADVVDRTPMSVPHWEGETYTSLVGAFVPRFLWPSKPTKGLGQRFGHRYDYLAPEDQTTSMNFPYLVEFYANFGILGVVFGMTVVGMLYRLVNDIFNPPRQGVVASILALGLLVPLMTAVESDFSLVFGGLILNGLALYVVLRLLAHRQPIKWSYLYSSEPVYQSWGTSRVRS